jgi:hypothetical protein
MRLVPLALAATAVAAALATPASASNVGACTLWPMQVPDAVTDAVGTVYDTAPPVRDAVWAACAL